MKWNKQWIMKQPDYAFDFLEEISFSKEAMLCLKVKSLKDTIVSGHGKLVQNGNQVMIDLNVKGSMILECALTLEEIEYPFQINSNEIFSFIKVNEDEDIHEAKKDVVDITPIIFQHIMFEVPSRVVKDGAKVHKEGNGWKVINEEEDLKEDSINPRLAKLKNYFKDKN